MFMYYMIGMLLNPNKGMLTHNTDCMIITTAQLVHLTEKEVNTMVFKIMNACTCIRDIHVYMHRKVTIY